MCVDVGGFEKCSDHANSGAASRPGAAARLRIIPVRVPVLLQSSIGIPSVPIENSSGFIGIGGKIILPVLRSFP